MHAHLLAEGGFIDGFRIGKKLHTGGMASLWQVTLGEVAPENAERPLIMKVPTVDEMANLLILATGVLPPYQLWVNPDCGLKTRGWPEVEAALTGMVEAAKRARRTLTKTAP